MRTLSIYQVEDNPIGTGGMGRVLRGTDPQGTPVAIKEILPEFASDVEIRFRTEQEVELLQRLNNDNIVKVYDQFPLNDNFYIVMEYVDGCNVEQYVQQNGPIPYERATRFMIQILDAMQAVHENQIVHRDMKPSNIMIRNNERICLLDFGVAKNMSNQNGGTQYGAVIGSDGYMSPEQADGYSIDHRSDIYALGCVFYYMLTGHHAYDTFASDFETRNNIANTPFPKLSKHSKQAFPKQLQEILDHATERSMMKRYQSCREFRKDLQALIPGTVVSQSKAEDYFITVGREGCDILIHDDLMKVSRSHLDIALRQFTGGRFYVITDHSSNGTMVNGRVLSRGESEKIPADGATPQVFLACDGNYPLNWEEVKRLIAKKIQESAGDNPVDYPGGTIIPSDIAGIPVSDEDYEPEDVTFIGAIGLFFKRATDFRGRSRRKEFWYIVLFEILLYVGALILTFASGSIEAAQTIGSLLGIWGLATCCPSVSLTVRRLHDAGKSGWWYFISIVPFIGSIWLLVLLLTDSEPYENNWGPCPK